MNNGCQVLGQTTLFVNALEAYVSAKIYYLELINDKATITENQQSNIFCCS